jgi:hypothetical protein
MAGADVSEAVAFASSALAGLREARDVSMGQMLGYCEMSTSSNAALGAHIEDCEWIAMPQSIPDSPFLCLIINQMPASARSVDRMPKRSANLVFKSMVLLPTCFLVQQISWNQGSASRCLQVHAE